MQLKSKVSQYKKINIIETVNKYPLLSEFKYHFILRKVYMPRSISLQQLAETLHEGFRISTLTTNSIYILQMVNVYEKDLVDLAVGFRKDQDAVKIARQVSIFQQAGHNAKIQLANGFKIFMEQLKNEADKSFQDQGFLDMTSLQDKQQNKSQKPKENKQLKQNITLQLQKSQSNKEIQQFPRERSRQKPTKKKDFRQRFQQTVKVVNQSQKSNIPQNNNYRLNLLLIPQQTSKNQIVMAVQKQIKDVRDIISYDFSKTKIPCFELQISKQESYEKLLNKPIKVNYFTVLPIGQHGDLYEQLLDRQLAYNCIQNSTTKSLATLLRQLKQRKAEIISIIARPTSNSQNFNEINSFNMACINSGSFSNHEYVVTFLNKINDINQYQLGDWKVQRNTNIQAFLQRPSVKWDWYRLMQQLDH